MGAKEDAEDYIDKVISEYHIDRNTYDVAQMIWDKIKNECELISMGLTKDDDISETYSHIDFIYEHIKYRVVIGFTRIKQ